MPARYCGAHASLRQRLRPRWRLLPGIRRSEEAVSVPKAATGTAGAFESKASGPCCSEGSGATVQYPLPPNASSRICLSLGQVPGVLSGRLLSCQASSSPQLIEKAVEQL